MAEKLCQLKKKGGTQKKGISFRYALLYQNSSGTVSFVDLINNTYIKHNISYSQSVTIEGHTFSLSYSGAYNLSISGGTISGFTFLPPSVTYSIRNGFSSGSIGGTGVFVFDFD